MIMWESRKSDESHVFSHIPKAEIKSRSAPLLSKVDKEGRKVSQF